MTTKAKNLLLHRRIVAIVVADLGTSVDDIRSTQRTETIALARAVIAYTLNSIGLPHTQIAKEAGWKSDHSSRSSLRKVEDGDYDEMVAARFPDFKTLKDYSDKVHERSICESYVPMTTINPLIMNKLVCVSTQISNKDLLRSSKAFPNGFSRKILLYIYIKHAGYTYAGAAQCLMRASESCVYEAIHAIDAGKLDVNAKHFFPRCNDAKDYARIMFERALNTPLPKHRQAVAS